MVDVTMVDVRPLRGPFSSLRNTSFAPLIRIKIQKRNAEKIAATRKAKFRLGGLRKFLTEMLGGEKAQPHPAHRPDQSKLQLRLSRPTSISTCVCSYDNET